jgi:hypothetical protein
MNRDDTSTFLNDESKYSSHVDENEHEKKSNMFLNMLNKFNQICNVKTQKAGHLFIDINENDMCSTNEKIENFNEYMELHKELETVNSRFIDVYDINSPIHNDDYDIYALIYGRENKMLYHSLSYISLLSIGVNKFKPTEEWTIIRL